MDHARIAQGRQPDEGERHVFFWLRHVPRESRARKPVPTTTHDRYTQLLTLYAPWYTITDDFTVAEHIRRGEHMQRPAPSESPDLTDLHWNMILQCWSPITSRPSASMATKFLKRRSEALSSNVGSFMAGFSYLAEIFALHRTTSFLWIL